MKLFGYLKITFSTGFILFSMLASGGENGDRYRQAGHPLTPAASLKELSFAEDASIRERVASNRKSPKEVLLRLAKDPAAGVKISLATNLSAPEEIYPILARDSELSVRSVVARFEYVPVVALEILANDKNVDIRREVARNLNTTKAILSRMTLDSDEQVKTIAELSLQRIKDEK